MAYKHDPSKSVSDNLRAYDEWCAQGDWFPANGGKETPFKARSGHTLLYCYQPRTGKHAYLNVETDTIIPDNEAINYITAWNR